jgi:hypothetical protein
MASGIEHAKAQSGDSCNGRRGLTPEDRLAYAGGFGCIDRLRRPELGARGEQHVDVFGQIMPLGLNVEQRRVIAGSGIGAAVAIRNGGLPTLSLRPRSRSRSGLRSGFLLLYIGQLLENRA